MKYIFKITSIPVASPRSLDSEQVLLLEPPSDKILVLVPPSDILFDFENEMFVKTSFQYDWCPVKE